MYVVNNGCKSLLPCCLASFFIAERRRPRYISLNVLTMKTSSVVLHFHACMWLCSNSYGAPLDNPQYTGRQSSALTVVVIFFYKSSLKLKVQKLDFFQ